MIRISPVRLIGPAGEQIGIVPLDVARETARKADLDLVEVAPTARPPVVRVMDWGKYQFEEQKRARANKKKQHTVDVKELKFRPRTDRHDLEFKLRNAMKFLSRGDRVKITVRFRGAELRHPEVGHELLDQIQSALSGAGKVESRSRGIEARQLIMVLAPQT